MPQTFNIYDHWKLIMKIRFEFNPAEINAMSTIVGSFFEYFKVIRKMLDSGKSNNDVKIKKDIIHWEKENIEDGVAVDIKVNSDWFCKLCNVYNKGVDVAFSMLITVAPAIALFAFKMKSVNAEYGEVLEELVQVPTEINGGESMTSEQGDSTTVN